MSIENREQVLLGVEGFEAQISDLKDQLERQRDLEQQNISQIESLKQEIEVERDYLRNARRKVEDLESKIRRIEQEIRHRDEQDHWRKVTGLRGF